MSDSQKILLFDELNTNAALAMTRHLNRLGYEVDLLVPHNHPARASKHCHCCHIFKMPVHDQQLYIKMLLDCLRNDSYLTVFIFEDHLTQIVCKHLNEIRAHTNLLYPVQYENVNLCLSKKDSFQFIEKIRVPIPKTLYINHIDEIKGAKDSFSYPIMVKGEGGTAALHVRKAYSFDELLACYAEIESLEKCFCGKPFLQEVIQGSGYVSHALVSNGQLVSLCIHRKVHEIPVSGGITSKGETVECEPIKAYTSKILHALDWNGLAKLDFIFDEKKNRFVFIEIDPRVSASIDICRVAGTSMIEKVIELLKGNPVEQDLSYKHGIQYTWSFPNELLYRLCTRSLPTIAMMSLINKNHRFDFAFNDFRPEIQKIFKTTKIIGQNFFKKTFWQGQVHL